MLWYPCHADTIAVTKSIGSTATSSQRTLEAVKYHQSLTLLFPELKMASFYYLTAVTKTRRVRSIEKNRQNLLKVIQKNQAHIKTNPPLYNDATLRTELTRYLDMLYIVMKEDFDKILDMEDIKAQTYDEDEAHQLALDLAFEKLENCRTFLTKADETFFALYGIKVDNTKDKITEKIEQANNAIKYYNPIYRVFFKVNREYSYTQLALAKKDLAELQQHAAALPVLAEDGIEKLKSLNGYMGDDELLKTVIEILKFYKSEGLVTIPANIAFFLKVEAFQNAQKKMESIRPESRTKSDIDIYNKSLDSYNTSVKEINQLNTSSNKKHNNYIDKWKKTVDTFFDVHS
jgi:hypothetical protein